VNAVRPLRRVRSGVARSRDERFELVRGEGCWQVRSLTAAGALDLQGGARRPNAVCAGISSSGWSRSVSVEMGEPILLSVHAACRISEGELRYQLAKRGHPLADSDGLLFEIAELERQGLVQTELHISLTDAGRKRVNS
jgi:hypothetical protein